MNTAHHTILCGVALIIVGIIIRYLIGRRKSERRNIAGLQQFRSYRHALFTNAWERAARFIGNLITVVGVLLLAAAAFTQHKFQKT